MTVDSMAGVLGAVLLLLGLALATVGLYGMLRKPNIFEQLHAAALVTGPGVILVLLASLATGHAESVTSALLVVGFLLVTASLSTHAIALAAWRLRERAVGAAPASRAAVGADRSSGSVATSAMRVLVATDGSAGGDTAVRLVSAMTLPEGSVVRVLGAVEGDLPEFASSAATTDGESMPLAVALDVAEQLLSRPGLTVDRVVRRGSPTQAILDEADAFTPLLVVVGSRGLGRVRSLLVGSVAAEVTDGAPCPVLIVRSTSLRQVLLAVDGSASAAVATDTVVRWPIFSGTHVHVLSVVRPAAADPAGAASGGPAATARAGGRLPLADAVVRRLHEAGRSATAHVRTGDPARAIVGFAADHELDLVVLGSRGHTGLRRELLGSVGRHVLWSGATSVLVIPARDSVSRPGQD